MNPLPLCKTRIVCTIGPASMAVSTLKEMIMSGMNIARLNFSHGDFSIHEKLVKNIRQAEEETGIRITIMADLPGPKMRLGTFNQEPVDLKQGSMFTLTTRDIEGDGKIVSMSFSMLPEVVKTGDTIFLNDGLVQLNVREVKGPDVVCMVKVGGELRSRKGVNLPGIDLGISSFTAHDGECLEFALKNGINAVSQSFVSSAADIIDVRKAAEEMGGAPFIIAKIERADVLERLEEVLDAADAIMVARGDLGVEIPIEQIAVTQKKITALANLKGKPVITATQMLESMKDNPRPTRAEATDVANAILDGTDCVMLSEESAMGRYPVDAVKMLMKIASSTEPCRPGNHYRQIRSLYPHSVEEKTVDIIACNVERFVQKMDVTAILAPTASGNTARRLTRFRLPEWIIAASPSEKTCHDLMFSYGVHPVYETEHPENWSGKASLYQEKLGIEKGIALLVEGPSPARPKTNHRIEILDSALKI